ncbi:MAG: hypothetical protein RIB45_14800 [Marivibrio sp.]|uniref:hypothetical protein n=1 Tax=Marivibrio sp. TaxID=2039719 RepID=UPI0032EF9FB0
MFKRFTGLTTALAGAALAISVASAPPAAAQLAIPSDAVSDCTLSESDLAGWFANGTIAADGAVNAADSLTFPNDSDICDFYKWGAQMFLWLASPEADGVVMTGSEFFDVSPETYDSASKETVRRLIPNDGSSALQLALRNQKFEEIEELAQAGSSGVLMSQGGSLLYYGVHVNEFYGYFLTAQKTADRGSYFGSIVDFAIGPNDVTQLQGFMQTAFPGVTLNSPQTLTMELKTSWVDAATVDKDRYVTIQATVPKFSPISSGDTTLWTPDGTEPKELALTGVHVVGTVLDHPEFVWATFEHVDNAPNNAFVYNTGSLANPTPKTQAYQAGGDFILRAAGATPSDANKECMIQLDAKKAAAIGVPAGSIAAVDAGGKPVYGTNHSPRCEGGIVASSTVRDSPWGSANANDMSRMSSADQTAIALNNSRLITLNADMIALLADAGDVRANYVQNGGIWTNIDSPRATDGLAPIPNKATADDLRGSLKLYNTTMETYTYMDSFAPNCFSCHALFKSGGSYPKNSFAPFNLSHIYSEIIPLTPTAGD